MFLIYLLRITFIAFGRKIQKEKENKKTSFLAVKNLMTAESENEI